MLSTFPKLASLEKPQLGSIPRKQKEKEMNESKSNKHEEIADRELKVPPSKWNEDFLRHIGKKKKKNNTDKHNEFPHE